MYSDDETEGTSTWKGIPATIICMSVYGQINKTAEVAHAATCLMIKQSLRLSGSNFIGVCLYGIENTNSSVLGINTVQEIFPLKLPTLADYEKLLSIDTASLNRAQNLILSDVFLYCSSLFASCKRQLRSRNIIILSRLDVPPITSDQHPALKRVVDITDSNIDVKLINIAESDYNIDLFYKNLLIEANKKEDIVLLKPVWHKNDIAKLMHQESHRHLAVARLNFEIGADLKIGVGVYTLMKSDRQYMKKTDLHTDTNAILTSINKTVKVTVKDDTMEVDEELNSNPVPLLKSELLYYQELGGEKISFTDDEMKILKNPFGPPMLKLLGFKPASIMCKEKWFLKPCYFLFPNDEIIEGSTVAFKALFRACVETNVVAFCVLCTRVNARPMIVALSPSSNPLGLNAEIGFDIIRVPFIENVRQIPVLEDDVDTQISEENKAVMKSILNKLQFDYQPNMFENPKIQKEYRAIEAIALEEDDEDEPFIDTTKPAPERFQELQDDLFQEMFGLFSLTTGKKTTSSGEGLPARKRAKQEINISLLEERLHHQKVKDYTVGQLRDILYSKDIPNLPALTGMKKDNLVELVYKYCK